MMYKEIEELRKRVDDKEKDIKGLKDRVEYLESAFEWLSELVSGGKFTLSFEGFKGCYGTTEKEDKEDDNRI